MNSKSYLLAGEFMLISFVAVAYPNLQGYPGKHKPLIDRETWGRVQALPGAHVYRSHEMTYLGDVIQCSHCGHPITDEDWFPTRA
jgi:hypothetical protein